MHGLTVSHAPVGFTEKLLIGLVLIIGVVVLFPHVDENKTLREKASTPEETNLSMRDGLNTHHGTTNANNHWRAASGQAYRTADEKYAARLLFQLSALLDKAIYSEQDRGEIKDLIVSLGYLGANALPAIHELLLSGENYDLATLKIGYPFSLRVILLKKLGGIEDPSVADVLTEVLEATEHPQEIAEISAILSTWPVSDWDRAELLGKAQNTLGALLAGGREHEVGPLLHVLGEWGDASTLATLQDIDPRLTPAINVALASLKDDSGIPSLAEQVERYGANTTWGTMALKTLAQASYSSDTAFNALLKLAVNGQIPDDQWDNLIPLLAGSQRVELIPGPAYQTKNEDVLILPSGQLRLYRVSYGGKSNLDVRQKKLFKQIYPYVKGKQVRADLTEEM